MLMTISDPSLDWDSAISWLRQNTKLQLWLKGGEWTTLHFAQTWGKTNNAKTLVYSPEDVTLAIQHGLDGIVVSNHGGRQLDGVPSTLDCLRVCAPVAAGKVAIAVDGGIRRGTDIFKALAMGASHCFVGRIPIWGLAVSSLCFPLPFLFDLSMWFPSLFPL